MPATRLFGLQHRPTLKILPTRHLALSLKMFTEHFLNALSWRKTSYDGLLWLVSNYVWTNFLLKAFNFLLPTRRLVSARHLAHSCRYVALKMFTEHFFNALSSFRAGVKNLMIILFYFMFFTHPYRLSSAQVSKGELIAVNLYFQL